MTSRNSDPKRGADGIWRHPSGRPASLEFHKLVERSEGRSLTAAASAAWAAAVSRWPRPGNELTAGVVGLVKVWRAEDAVKKLKASRAQLATEALEKAGARSNLAWRAAAARATLRAVDRQARNISIRETANWKKR